MARGETRKRRTLQDLAGTPSTGSDARFDTRTRDRGRRAFLTGATAALTLGGVGLFSPAVADPRAWSDMWGLALRGYDPVAYFTRGAPTKGAARYEMQWRGASWRFASMENLAEFASAPDAYAPQFGGYCAWGMTQGAQSPIDPTAWEIYEGKLYVSQNAAAMKAWRKDRAKHVAAADAHWGAMD